VDAEPTVVHDVFSNVRQQFLQVDGVVVWANSIEDGVIEKLLLLGCVRWLLQVSW
jgi:hypothetical protein